MGEPQYDAETLGKVTALAARLQNELEDRRLAHRGRLTAEEMDQIGREVGVDPALMRQALGYITAQEAAKRRATNQTRLAVGACCGFLAAGLIFGYKVHLNNQALGTFDANEIRVPARERARTDPDPGPDFATENDESEVRRLVEIENRGANARDVKVVQSVYGQGYVLHTKDGKWTGYFDTMRQLEGIPGYPRDWRREILIRRTDFFANRIRVFMRLRMTYTNDLGRYVTPEYELMETWNRINGTWQKTETREL